MMSACGGTPQSAQGSILPVRFETPQAAVLAVRRLEWVLQGLSEGSSETAAGAKASATVLIHAAADPESASLPSVLEKAAPGQVLLSNSAAEMVRSLPNVTVRDPGDGNLHELLWNSREIAWSYPSDEQAVLRLIRDLGRNDPAPELALPPPGAVPVEAPAEEPQPEGLGRSRTDEGSWTASDKKKWLILGGVAAAVVLVLILVIPALMSGKHKAVSPPPVAATPSAAPATSAPKPAAGAKPQELKSKSTRVKNESQSESKPEPAGKASCNLTEGEIPRALSRAESLMYAGKLEDSQAVYEGVVGCPSAREKAQEGLQRVKQRIAAQRSSEP